VVPKVRAIDLHAIHEGIEEADFNRIPVARREDQRYDVIVCSMVLNCLTTPSQRGEMIARLYHFLRPGGCCFITIPKSCLTLSPYMDRGLFKRVLEAVGLELVETKESPKVSFYVCQRPSGMQQTNDNKIKPWSESVVAKIREGRKYRNDFCVTLEKDQVMGDNLTYI